MHNHLHWHENTCKWEMMDVLVTRVNSLGVRTIVDACCLNCSPDPNYHPGGQAWLEEEKTIKQRINTYLQCNAYLSVF